MSAQKIKQRAAKIKGLIVSTGLTQAFLADALKVERVLVAQSLNVSSRTGDFILKNPYIREGIARHLGLPYQAVWGEALQNPNPAMRRSPFYHDRTPSVMHDSMREDDENHHAHQER